MSETNPLSSLSPEQLDRLYKALNKATVVPKVESQDHDRDFYLIQVDRFETTVPMCDAASPELALEIAMDSLQPWYFIKQPSGTHVDYNAKVLTHNEWCDWVRS